MRTTRIIDIRYFGFDNAAADTSKLSVQSPVYERIPKAIA